MPVDKQKVNKKAAETMRLKRAFAKDVAVPPCADRIRREWLEQNDEEWLLYYFAVGSNTQDPFSYAFTTQQKKMLAAIKNAIVEGEDEAIAATRGEGKSSYAERLLLKYSLQGILRFSVLFAATGSAAEDSLESIKGELECNDHLLADYPEVCVPVRALENTPSRAHYQTVTGNRHDNDEPFFQTPSRFTWCGQEVYFPAVPGSPSSGVMIATRGLDSAIRGLKKKGVRPNIVIIDDPDTEDSARSEDQATKIERRLDRSLAALGSQKRRVARVMLTTIQSRISVSYKYTDPTQKPSWHGKRFRFLIKPPERQDLWDEYILMRHDDWRNDTNAAHDYYLTNFEEMNFGAEVSNENRKDKKNITALQFYYDQVARTDKESVATEYDNNPPEETGFVESGINPTRIQKQVNGYARRVIPPGCVLLTQGIDVRKVALHWVIRAWCPDGTGHTIDYGIHELRGTVSGSDEGVDVAIKRGIIERIDEMRTTEYRTLEDATMSPDLTLVDAGYRTSAVYSACTDIGVGIMPVMGFGKSSGCVQTNFSDVQHRTIDRRPGDGWFLSRKGRIWLVCADTDRWKAWEHDRWMTDPGKSGSMQLYGDDAPSQLRMSTDQKFHHSYARHICNEIEVEEPYKGSIRRVWKVKQDNNHWLDASYYSDIAASIRGITLIGARAIKDMGKKASMTLAEMAKAASAGKA